MIAGFFKGLIGLMNLESQVKFRTHKPNWREELEDEHALDPTTQLPLAINKVKDTSILEDLQESAAFDQMCVNYQKRAGGKVVDQMFNNWVTLQSINEAIGCVFKNPDGARKYYYIPIHNFRIAAQSL
jgi:hypothetical protein